MKVIAIILFLTISLAGFSTDTACVLVSQKTGNPVTIDTLHYKFQQDTIKFADRQHISQIIYAEHESKIDIWLGYIFPIIMLLLGVGIDRLIIYLSEKKRIKKIGKRWVVELKSLRTPIKMQQENFNNFITDYCDEEDRFNIPDVSFHSSINGTKFESLAKEELYEYLEAKQKEEKATEDFNKITSILSDLKVTYDQVTKIFDDFKSESSSYINLYNSNLQAYNKELYRIEKQIFAKKMSKRDYDLLVKLYEVEITNKMPNINVFETENTFIQPSLKELSKYNRDDISSLNSPLMSCLDNIQGLKNEKRYIKESLEKIKGTYTKIDEILVSILSDLSSRS